MDFQKYNIKEKKKKKETKERKSHKNYLKTTTTTKRVYMVFALKIGFFFYLKSNSRL